MVNHRMNRTILKRSYNEIMEECDRIGSKVLETLERIVRDQYDAYLDAFESGEYNYLLSESPECPVELIDANTDSIQVICYNQEYYHPKELDPEKDVFYSIKIFDELEVDITDFWRGLETCEKEMIIYEYTINLYPLLAEVDQVLLYEPRSLIVYWILK